MDFDFPPDPDQPDPRRLPSPYHEIVVVLVILVVSTALTAIAYGLGLMREWLCAN